MFKDFCDTILLLDHLLLLEDKWEFHVKVIIHPAMD